MLVLVLVLVLILVLDSLRGSSVKFAAATPSWRARRNGLGIHHGGVQWEGCVADVGSIIYSNTAYKYIVNHYTLFPLHPR